LNGCGLHVEAVSSVHPFSGRVAARHRTVGEDSLTHLVAEYCVYETVPSSAKTVICRDGAPLVSRVCRKLGSSMEGSVASYQFIGSEWLPPGVTPLPLVLDGLMQ
jgi:hypothetical protein